MEEWFEVVVEILQSHKQGDYSILQEAQTLPDNAPLEIKALLCMSICQVAMDANEVELAKKYLEMAIECADNDATNMVQHEQLFYLECLLYSKFFHSFDKTIAKARGSRYKNHYLMQSIVGDCLYWCGYFSEAKEIYAKILAKNTSEDFNKEEYEYKLASACVKLGEHKESKQVFEQIVVNHPNIENDTPEYVFHSIGELVALDPNAAQAHTKKLQDLELQHPYKNAHINYILGLEIYLRCTLGLQASDDLDKATYFFHAVLQSPIRNFEKLPSVRYLIHIHHHNQQPDDIKKLQQNYSFTNMFWEQEIQNLLSPEKLASPIETQEPPYEEDPIPTLTESQSKTPEVTDTTAKNKDTAQPVRKHRSILPNVSPTKNNVKNTSESVENTYESVKSTSQSVESASQSVESASQSVENTPQSVENASQSTENTSQSAENTETIETSIPLTALLLGLESFHKQN